jgi:hypothetical protein
LNALKKIDKSDWFDNTQKQCEASHPGNKQKMWDIFFDKENPIHKEWGLLGY